MNLFTVTVHHRILFGWSIFSVSLGAPAGRRLQFIEMHDRVARPLPASDLNGASAAGVARRTDRERRRSSGDELRRRRWSPSTCTDQRHELSPSSLSESSSHRLTWTCHVAFQTSSDAHTPRDTTYLSVSVQNITERQLKSPHGTVP